MSIRVLIADDNDEFRLSASLMMSRAGDIQVVSLARDGREAVEQSRQHQPDVALIDVHMPELDGLSAIRTLAELSPQIACMAMSFDGERDLLRQAMAAGAREYLLKPFNGDEMINAVRRVAALHSRHAPGTGGLAAAQARHKEREQAVMRLAVDYLRSGRHDAEASRVYAELVRLPGLEAKTLARLAEVFLARRDWHVLRLICERLEHQTKIKPSK
jgi:DNA-binding NarL/FixJ family response regulator